HTASLGVSLALGLLAAACSSKSSSEEAPKPASTGATTAAPASAAPPPASASAAAAANAAGPTASIPAGQLIAGTACGDQPRQPGEELAGEAIEMGAFDIDAYPYPNDPAKPPLTSTSRDEARKLCEARGRRLCTELE